MGNTRDLLKTQNFTPPYYYKESRDFQFFGRLYDVILNYNKGGVDLMRSFPINYQTDTKLLTLLTRTLGLFLKGNYSNKDLNRIANTFSEIIRNKGSITSIELLVKTLLKSVGVEDATYEITVEEITIGDTSVPVTTINIPDFVYDPTVRLMEEVLDYILPIGTLYSITPSHGLNETFEGTLGVRDYAKLDKPAEESSLSKLADASMHYVETTPVVSNNNVTNKPITQGDTRVTQLIKKGDEK